MDCGVLMSRDSDRPRGGWPDRFAEPPAPIDDTNWITDADAKTLDLILEFAGGTREEFDALSFETKRASEVAGPLDAAKKALDELYGEADEIRSEAVTG